LRNKSAWFWIPALFVPTIAVFCAVYVLFDGTITDGCLGSCEVMHAQMARLHREAGPGFLAWHWGANGLRLGDPPYGDATREGVIAWVALFLLALGIIVVLKVSIISFSRQIRTIALSDPKKSAIEDYIAQLRGEELARAERDALREALSSVPVAQLEPNGPEPLEGTLLSASEQLVRRARRL